MEFSVPLDGIVLMLYHLGMVLRILDLEGFGNGSIFITIFCKLLQQIIKMEDEHG